MDHKTTEQDTSCLPEPLTRRNLDGKIYQRQQIVNKQIQKALGFGHEELRRRLEVKDKTSPGFLKEESLVYLIRHYHKAENLQCVNNLSKCLLTRCSTLINSKLDSLNADLRDEGYWDVVAELFARILDLDSDRGDFLQVRFWMGLKRLTVQVFRKYIKQCNRELLVDDEREAIDELTHKRETGTTYTPEPRTVDMEPIKWTLIREALCQLEEPFRSAFLLRRYYEWPIEAQNPNVRTISQHFNKTPRTIRNWLARAEECLTAWRGEQK